MRVFKCDLCPFQCNKNTTLKYHKLSIHSDLRPWKCTRPGCSYNCKLKGSLKVHLRLHESNPLLRKPFACTFKDCDYRASQKSSLKTHVRIRHTPGRSRDFHCTFSPASYYEKSILTPHIQTHVNEKAFQCSVCKYRTNQSSNLGQRIRIVHERRTVTCSIAGCTFASSVPYLSQHRKMHHADPAARSPISWPFPTC